MRSSLLLAALAVGSVNALVKREYVTDWTTVIVTKTVIAPAETTTVPATHQGHHPTPDVVTETTTAQAPAETDHTAPSKKTTVVAPGTTTAQAPENSPAPESQPQPQAQPKGQTQPQPKGQAQPQPKGQAQQPTTSESTSTTEPASTTLSTTTAASGPTANPINQYQQAVLYNHNIHRSNHSAPSVDWSADLESSAHKLAARCVYQHDTSIDGGGYGQNIGYGVKKSQIGVLITNLMYNDEIGYFPTPYGQANPSMTYFEKWGHFSQIVWKDTTHVGCATVMCNSLGNVDSSTPLPFTVCNYSPPGNYGGEYGGNVQAPVGHAVYHA